MVLLSSYLEQYLIEQQEERNHPLSIHTLDAYRVDIRQFSDWQEEKGLSLPDVTFAHLKEYRQGMEEKYSISSIDRKTATINKLLKHLHDTGKNALSRQIPRVKHQDQSFLPDMLSNLDFERTLRQIRKAGDLQTEAAAMLIYYTGARASELVQLKIKDIESETVRILGKGSKYRELFLPKILRPYLRAWATESGKQGEEYLFSPRGEPDSPQTRSRLFARLKYYAGQARIAKAKMSPHALRHLYTKNLSEIGVNYAAIRQLLGHSAKDTTDIYLSLGKKELLSLINKIGTPEDRAKERNR